MYFVYHYKELKYFNENLDVCYNWILSNQTYTWDQARKMGWMILDQPIGDLGEFLSIRDEILKLNTIATMQLKKEYNYFRGILGSMEIKYLTKFKLLLPLELFPKNH